jgi:excisionase family DNA binding protein
MSPRCLTMAEAAVQIGAISRDMLYKLASEGRIPYVRIGRRVLIKADDIPAIIDSFTVAAS